MHREVAEGGGVGEEAVHVVRDGGVDGDGVNRLNTPVGETLQRRGEKKKDETRERVMASCTEVCQDWY